MADLIVRPETPARASRPVAPRQPRGPRHDHAPQNDGLAERLITTQSPQRPQSTPAIRIEVDGRVVEGLEGQTILEVCRDNGIEIPTLCYEPKLPGFGACRMCVVEVEGEEKPPISCSRDAEAGMVVADPDRGDAPAAADEPRADLLGPQRVLPPAVPEQVPEPHRHPGLPQGERRGQLARVDPDLQAHDPVPQRARPRLPRPVRGALPARRGGRGDRDPRQPPLRRRPGHPRDARRGRRPAAAVRAAGRVRAPRRGDRLRARRHGRRLLPAAVRPRRDGVRARPVARRHAPLRHPAVPPAQGRGPRGRVRVGDPARRQDALQHGPRARLHARRPPEPGLRRRRRRHRLLRHQQAGHPERGRGRGHRRPRVPADRDARPAVPGPRGQPGRRRRRRLHLDGLLADVGPPGRQRGHARLPPRHEGHAGVERGPRGDRGRRDRHLPGRPDAGHHRREDRQGHGDRVHPDGARASPTPPAAAAPSPSPGTEFTIPCDRVLLAIGQGPELDLDPARLRGDRTPPSSGASRPTR